MIGQRFAELGFYTLPGYALDPTAAYEEISTGDELGLGSVWISERQNTKDIGVISGMAAATTKNMGIAAGLISHLPFRHPFVVAGYGSTMAVVSNNRFALGIGRSLDQFGDMTGTARIKFKLLEDYVGILRRLWNGETVNYEGPAGVLRNVALGITVQPPPIIMAAMGEKTCYWAGQHCDGVVFNSLWTPKSVAAATALVRRGAEDAGRDPASVQVWAIQVTASEVSEEDFLKYIIRRMNTYVLFPSMINDVCKSNGWDPTISDRIRKKLQEIDGDRRPGAAGDEHTTRDLDVLREVRKMYPDEWIFQGNAVGSGPDCAKATRAHFDAGVDGVLFHGSPPAKLAPLLKHWPIYRPSHCRTQVNPGA